MPRLLPASLIAFVAVAGCGGAARLEGSFGSAAFERAVKAGLK